MPHVHVFLLLLVIMTATGENDSHHTTQEGKNNHPSTVEVARKKEGGMMQRILPLMIIPFMISTAIIPMMLISLKAMLLKSAFTGTLAVVLLILNLFHRRDAGQGGVFTHNVIERDMPMAHYGYSGDEEYGAYINRRKRDLIR